MSCPAQNYNSFESQNEVFTNWSERVTGTSKQFFKPNSLPELVNVVMRATSEGRQLRVMGSKWSFEDIAYSPDWMISIEELHKPLFRVLDSALNAEWVKRRKTNSGDTLFHVEAGIKIGILNDLLKTVGLALPTLGGANGQTLAGAIATGTHGGDIAYPPLPDLVMAMHVVTTGGREIWVERASESITEDVPLAFALDCLDAEIIRDDALFNAMAVGLGRFGIVYSYVLRVTQAFRLTEWTIRLPRVVVTAQLRTGIKTRTFLKPLLDILPDPPANLEAIDVKNPRGFEITFDTQNLDFCYVRRRWKTDNQVDLHVDYQEDSLCVLGSEGVLKEAISSLSKPILLSWIPIAGWIVGRLFQSKIDWLIRKYNADPSISAGEMFAHVLRVIWDLKLAGHIIPQRSSELFNERYKDSMNDGKRGSSALITSGYLKSSEQNCYRVDSIEPAFDAWKSNYIDFLDAIVTKAPSQKQAGYISLRWCATSKATLSMHNFNSANGVSLEVTSLKGLPDNSQWMQIVETLAVAFGGRPHWGQINNLNANVLLGLYNDRIEEWRIALTSLCGKSILFRNAYTFQRGLEPIDDQTSYSISGKNVGDLRSTALAAISLLLLED